MRRENRLTESIVARSSLQLLTAALLISLLAAEAARSDEPAPADSKRIDAFTLNDSLGGERSLSDWNDSPIVVVTFIGTECPLARLYAPRLVALSEKYAGKGVQFAAIDSNQQDSLAEIGHFAKLHNIAFPVLKDPANAVADQFGAVRTPETFVLDKERFVRYRGKIDDQYGVGYARGEPALRHLEEALDDLLAGRLIRTPVTDACGCYIGRVNRRNPTGDVTYSNQISRLLRDHCVVCHREGQIAPFALTSYSDVAAWAETIREVVEGGRMPPWHANPEYGRFANEAVLSDDEKSLVSQWNENGLPEGNAAELPAPIEYPEGWRIPQPDLVVKMPEAYRVPATGTVEYQYFMVDPGFKEDVWVRASEGRAGNPNVVHHLILFYLPPGEDNPRPQDALFNAIASYVPGAPAFATPEGCARRIPAGSRLAFQVHYTPNGREQLDQSEAGLVFADPEKVKKEMLIGMALNFRFLIPPGAKNHEVEARERFTQDVLIHALVPHMHLRGKSFRYTALYPNNRREILLDVPHYDFNWQNSYVLAEPKLMRDTTELECVAHYDNSDDNLSNPDSQKAVHWGDQTWDEMMVGSYYFSRAEQDLTLGPPRATRIGEDRYEVQFRYRPSAGPKTVALAGTFNEWKTDNRMMDGPDAEGFYTTKLELSKGAHEYKFVVDGEVWKQDPGNREQAGFFHNSVISLGE